MEDQADNGVLTPGFLEALRHTYADLLRRQRTAASPLVNWTHTTSRRSPVWLGKRWIATQEIDFGEVAAQALKRNYIVVLGMDRDPTTRSEAIQADGFATRTLARSDRRREDTCSQTRSAERSQV